MSPPVPELLASFEPISLEEVDETAALQRRVDQKYLLRLPDLARLRFERFTLVARDGSERVTCDLSLQLVAPAGESAALKPGHALLETKSEGAGQRCDRLLETLGVEPISFSKYRVGIGLLVASGDEEADAMAPHFQPASERAADASTR